MVEIIIVNSESDVIKTLCDKLTIIANASINLKSTFRVGLSGGSLTKYLSTGLPNIETDWSKWEFYFCDERYVSVLDADSTFGVYKNDLLPKIPALKESQFIIIREELELTECAKDYEVQIRQSFKCFDDNIPEFDLLLLGMGPDGHTCSLFPGHALLNERNKLVAHIDDSPKEPPKRVTMTYKLIENAKHVMFAMAGSGKADMVKKILVDKEPLPAGLAKPSNGNLIWILDESAGVHLK